MEIDVESFRGVGSKGASTLVIENSAGRYQAAQVVRGLAVVKNG